MYFVYSLLVLLDHVPVNVTEEMQMNLRTSTVTTITSTSPCRNRRAKRSSPGQSRSIPVSAECLNQRVFAKAKMT